MKCTVTLAGWLPTTKFLNSLIFIKFHEILLVERAPRDQVPPVGLLWPNYISLSPERLKFVCLIQFYWNFAVWFPLVERAATWPSPPGGTLHQKFGSVPLHLKKKKKCLNSRNEEIDSNYENRKKFPPTFSPRRHIFLLVMRWTRVFIGRSHDLRSAGPIFPGVALFHYFTLSALLVCRRCYYIIGESDGFPLGKSF